MVTAGRWRATRPDVRGHAGFRINALVSLLANASWAKLAAEFIAAKDDPAELQVFGNTGLAQGWADRGLGFDRCDRWVSVGPMVAMARVPTTRNHQVYAARRG